MKKIEFRTIGEYSLLEHLSTTDKYITKIELIEKYRNAVIRLDDFSHCLVFTKQEKMLMCYGVEINTVDESNGVIVVKGDRIQGDLLDVKAYFPSQERIENPRQEKINPVIIPFKGHEVGRYIYDKNRNVIHIKESVDLTNNEIESTLQDIHVDDCLRILWWFHKNDNQEARDTCMITPPFENAPKSGVFATRSPVRPNLIASTVVKVKSVDKHSHFIEICGFEGFENTRILQIMSYSCVPVFDDVTVPNWVEKRSNHRIFRDHLYSIKNLPHKK